MKTRNMKNRKWKGLCLAALGMGAFFGLGAPLAAAMPQGGALVCGSAWLHRGDDWPTDLSSLQTGDELVSWGNTVIRWESFDIAAGEALCIKNQSGTLVNLINSEKATHICGTLEQYGAAPCYIVNTNGIALGTGAMLRADHLVLSTAGASEDEWKVDPTKASQTSPQGALAVDAGSVTAGDLALKGTSVRVADGVYFTVTPGEDAQKGSLRIEATEDISFAGHIERYGAEEKPVEVALSAPQIDVEKRADYMGVLKLSGNGADSLALRADHVTVDGGELYSDGSLTIESPDIKAVHSACIYADGAPRQTDSSIWADDSAQIGNYFETRHLKSAAEIAAEKEARRAAEEQAAYARQVAALEEEAAPSAEKSVALLARESDSARRARLLETDAGVWQESFADAETGRDSLMVADGIAFSAAQDDDD